MFQIANRTDALLIVEALRIARVDYAEAAHASRKVNDYRRSDYFLGQTLAVQQVSEALQRQLDAAADAAALAATASAFAP
jgi:hypothetical protein